MLMQRENSLFLLVDLQEKLTPHVMDSEPLIKTCQWLLRLAKTLAVPQLVSEHYSRGLGVTVEPLKDLMGMVTPFEKVHFSCYKDQAFIDYWQAQGRKQAIITGIETHVCVLQTAIDMIEAGFEVFVVVDAVSCRKEQDQKYALKRMKQAGVQLVTSEMVFFEWVERAGTPEFKALSQSFLK